MFMKDLENNISYKFEKNKLCDALYRPFVKIRLVYEKQFIQRTYQQTKLFPSVNTSNILICTTGIGSTKNFSALICDKIPCLDLVDKSQCFPLYWYEKKEHAQGGLFEKSEDEYIRHDGISDFILEQTQSRYGHRVEKEDIFYYVYGILHSPEYRKTFASDLKKMLPRLPLVEKTVDFWSFSKAGRELAKLHLHYEEQEQPSNVKVSRQETSIFTVEKIKFGTEKWGGERWGTGKWGDIDKSKIIYNFHITISNIPAKAYEYIVNGKSAIEWVMDRYAITTHKESGIKNDPNEWAKEHGNPRYILDLLLSVITVSLKTVEIVERLPNGLKDIII
jgi:predicted helicase